MDRNGRRRFWEGAAASILLSGCITRPSPTPYPCDRIDEVPGLHEEMAALHVSDSDRERIGLSPTTERLRAYAKDASVKCAADRELGALPILEPVPPLPWYTRFHRWMMQKVAF